MSTLSAAIVNNDCVQVVGTLVRVFVCLLDLLVQGINLLLHGFNLSLHLVCVRLQHSDNLCCLWLLLLLHGTERVDSLQRLGCILAFALVLKERAD